MVDTRKNNKNKRDMTKNKKNLNSAVKTRANSLKFKKKPAVLVSKVNNAKKKKVKRINYSHEELEKAIKLMDTGISLRKAANAFGVPATTLARRKNNSSIIKKKTGPPTILTPAEEEEIINWIIYKAERGFPVTKTELLDSIQKYIESLKRDTPFIQNRPGRHWYEGFRKRHPNMSIRKVQHLSLSRAAVTRDDLIEWFNVQGSYLKNKNLLDISPNRIFNCDETNILMCPDSEKVLTEKGCRSAYKITDAGKEGLTVLFMYSAAGTRAPPMLMFPYIENVPKKIIENTPNGWGIGISESGWMTTETFYEYVTNVFYPWLVKENIEFPVIIYLDNHASHITIPLVSFCRNKQIEIIGLHPNSTHIMQPLDIAFFHPFKQMWKKTVPKWKNQKNVMRLKKEDFPTVLKTTLDNMNEEKNIIKSGFKASGLVPFNPNAVDYDVLQKKKKSTSISTLNEENITEHQVSNNGNEDVLKQHLQIFENTIPHELLLSFKNALSNGSWTGDIEKKALFEYWLQIRQTPFDDSLRVKPIVRSVENLIDFEFKVLGPETIENRRDLILENDIGNFIPERVLKVDNITGNSVEENVNVEYIDTSIILNNDIVMGNVLEKENTEVPVNQNDSLRVKPIVRSVENLIDFEFKVLGPDTIENRRELILENDISNFIPERVLKVDNITGNSVEENVTVEYIDTRIILNNDIVMGNVLEKENTRVTTNQKDSNIPSSKNFAEAFTLPTKYLPKKKKNQG